MIIIKNENEVMCDECLDKAYNQVVFTENTFYLCDECLQELNCKIVEHLAEKNL